MARTVDDALHDSKRNAILDVAERLIGAKGFEQTSLQDLLDALGWSKGAFYHYFESKQEVVVALVERRTATIEAGLAELAEDTTLAAREKLVRHLAAVDAWKLAEGRVVSAAVQRWYADENAAVLHRLYVAGVRRFAPLLARVVKQGVDEGDFTTRYAGQAARMILALRFDLGQAYADALAAREDSPAQLSALATATADAIERVLGATPGTVTTPTRKALGQWRASLRKSRARQRRHRRARA